MTSTEHVGQTEQCIRKSKYISQNHGCLLTVGRDDRAASCFRGIIQIIKAKILQVLFL